MASDDETWVDRVMNEWWGKLVGGVACIAASVFLYVEIVNIESGARSSVRVNWFIKLAYEWGGKWTATGLMCAIGIGLVCWGIVQRVRGDE